MSARAAIAWALAGCGLSVALACSAMIEADLAQVSCTREGSIGPPDCPAGQACRAGSCSPCGAQEICGNGADDDCDGVPDDGCNDGGGAGGVGGGDGGSAGSGGDSGGGSGGTLAGGGGAAGSGGTGGAGGSGGTGGTGGTGGSGGTGGTAPGSIGATCTSAAECDSILFCANPSAFGGASGPKVCTRSCCKSEECGAGTSVCYPSPDGGSACVPAASVGRGNLGTGAAGDACSVHSECRSGLCEANKCFDTCCGDATCSGSQYCVKKTLPGTSRSVMACGAAVGNGGYQAFCSVDSQCQSGICSSGIYCSKACCTAKDCAGTANFVCLHVVPGLRRCSYPGFTPGPKLLGAECAGNGECKSGHCLGPTGGPFYCSDTCCSNSDCGGGFSCSAANVGGTNQLLCVKL